MLHCGLSACRPLDWKPRQVTIGPAHWKTPREPQVNNDQLERSAGNLQTRDELLAQLAGLRQARVGQVRVPHKPLLLLWPFGQFAGTSSSAANYRQAEEPVSQLRTPPLVQTANNRTITNMTLQDAARPQAQRGAPLPVYYQQAIIAAMPAKTAGRTLLESLVGQPISTVTGRPNTVLRVEGDSVVVATSRSPTGQPVPIEWVQSGLEKLLETGEIEVSVPSLGHRSSFVGAVLLTLPDAVLVRTTPPRIRLNQCTTGEC